MSQRNPSSPKNQPGMPLNYRQAGVDIDAANDLIQRIKPHAARTHRPGVLKGLGGFGALFELPLDRYQEPVLVSSTDGVGTKLKLAINTEKHDTIGIDLVAMCVNDLIVQGADPLFFLDYYATGRLSVDTATEIIIGIARGCELAGTALIGGETAEMPGMYADNDYDLAGFCVGVVEKSQLIDGSNVATGDVLIGLASSGPHSNGYSLIRKVIEVTHADLSTPFDGTTLGEVLLEPTHIYVKPILKLLQEVKIHAIAHITGGGLLENLPRVMPDNTRAIIDTHTWRRPAIFDWIQSQAQIETQEMYRTFNCGIGMVLMVDEKDVHTTLDLLTAASETATPIGRIEDCLDNTARVLIDS